MGKTYPAVVFRKVFNTQVAIGNGSARFERVKTEPYFNFHLHSANNGPLTTGCSQLTHTRLEYYGCRFTYIHQKLDTQTFTSIS